MPESNNIALSPTWETFAKEQAARYGVTVAQLVSVALYSMHILAEGTRNGGALVVAAAPENTAEAFHLMAAEVPRAQADNLVRSVADTAVFGINSDYPMDQPASRLRLIRGGDGESDAPQADLRDA